MDLGLKNKLIVVGGGAGGIGRIVCETLLTEGAEVIVADVANGDIDLCSPNETQRFFQDLKKHHKQLSGYCSLVYGGGGESGLLDSSLLEIRSVLNNTLLAAVFPIQEAVRWMKKTGGGNIVVVSSVNSILGLNEFAYDIAKGALNRIAPDIATGHGKDGIYATTLCLGTICGTPSWKNRDKDLVRIASAIPDNKVTTTQEVANMIAFLLSHHSMMLNGSTIIADRGWSLKPPFKSQ
ncbi:MAG: hypothetical protein US98_C0060G0002 [Parcubacteria group bacterium GW2011_GWC1_38_6]|nr:MAG: hypothetical protein US98_C0060G0002 [Parcubacteria group bacterium GW2011_GWC1_38_6]